MSNEDIKKEVKKITKSIFEELVCIRRWIHKHPELSFQEKNTSNYICSILDKYDIPYKKNIGGFGIVACIESNKPNDKVIAIRADMDALPIQEKNDVSYKSLNDGVMHACGHDVHSAIVLGTAIVLNKLKNKLKGSIKFIFQPAEEQLPGGASIMIKEGVLEKPHVDLMLALHVYPEFEVGTIGFRSGKYMAACDELSVTISGKGGHAALPDKVINPITVASKFILDIQKKAVSFSRGTKYVLEFGDFHACGATNVIPDTANLQGTLRTLDEDVRNLLHQLLLDESKVLSKESGASCLVKIKKGYPALYNHPELTKYCQNYTKEFLNNDAVKELDIRMSSEDFSYFSQVRPACFFRLGVGNIKKKITHLVHSPHFNVDEKSIEIGVGLMSYLAIANLLNPKKF